jgi:hypothetical protein
MGVEMPDPYAGLDPEAHQAFQIVAALGRWPDQALTAE